MATEIKQPTNQVISLGDRIISIASSQLGFAEDPKGSNRGKHVEKYLKSIGLDGGHAWCMAFVYWCVNEACKESGVANPLVKTGGVLRQWNEINKKYKVTGNPEKGDIFIMDFGKGKGHTGFVTGYKMGKIMTIEGNSNDEGSRDGFEVCRKPGGREMSTIKGYIRL